MTLPPVVTDMPPVESKRGKMPPTVLAICILQGIYLVFGVFGFTTTLLQTPEEIREQTIIALQAEYEKRGLDPNRITEKEIERVIGISSSFKLTPLIGLILSALLFWGYWVGNRLLWYFYRTLGLLGAILLTLSFIFSLVTFSALLKEDPSGKPLFGFLLMLYSITISWGIYFILGTESARDFFSAICPRCRSKKIKPINFFATKVCCKACGTEWT